MPKAHRRRTCSPRPRCSGSPISTGGARRRSSSSRCWCTPVLRPLRRRVDGRARTTVLAITLALPVGYLATFRVSARVLVPIRQMLEALRADQTLLSAARHQLLHVSLHQLHHRSQATDITRCTDSSTSCVTSRCSRPFPPVRSTASGEFSRNWSQPRGSHPIWRMAWNGFWWGRRRRSFLPIS